MELELGIFFNLACFLCNVLNGVEVWMAYKKIQVCRKKRWWSDLLLTAVCKGIGCRRLWKTAVLHIWVAGSSEMIVAELRENKIYDLHEV